MSAALFVLPAPRDAVTWGRGGRGVSPGKGCGLSCLYVKLNKRENCSRGIVVVVLGGPEERGRACEEVGMGKACVS